MIMFVGSMVVFGIGAVVCFNLFVMFVQIVYIIIRSLLGYDV